MKFTVTWHILYFNRLTCRYTNTTNTQFMVRYLLLHSQDKVPVRESIQVNLNWSFAETFLSLVQPHKGYVLSMVPTQTYIMSGHLLQQWNSSHLLHVHPSITKTWRKPQTSPKNNLTCTAFYTTLDVTGDLFDVTVAYSGGAIWDCFRFLGFETRPCSFFNTRPW